MAIDRTGITSLDAGAGEITYSGNEGPKSPDQQLMAQADPMLVEMYQQYVFEMEEQGLQPISFREFMDQIIAESRIESADGGIARLGYKDGEMVQAGAVNYNPSEMVSVPTEFRARSHSPNTHLAYITDDEAGILQALKPDTPHMGPQGIPNYDSYDAQGGYATSQQLDSPTAGDIRAGVGSGGAGAGGEKTHIGPLSKDAKEAWKETAPERKEYKKAEEKEIRKQLEKPCYSWWALENICTYWY